MEDLLEPRARDWNTAVRLIAPVSRLAVSPYVIELDNYAVGKERRINDLHDIQIMPIPLAWLTGIATSSPRHTQGSSTGEMDQEVPIRYANPTMYLGSIDSPNTPSLLTLRQNYDTGWLAFAESSTFPYLSLLPNHVPVNNWANGWELRELHKTSGLAGREKQTIFIFFWPQILEFIGFALLPLPFFLVLKKKTTRMIQ